MRVALVTPYSWSEPGGVNMHVRELGAHLRSRGHEVRIIAPSDAPVEPGVIRLGRTVGVPFNQGVARVAPGPRAAARLRVALKRARPDVVHIHNPLVPPASLAPMLTSAPVVATFHSGVPSRLTRAAGVAMRPLRRRIRALIAVSDHARQIVERAMGGEAEVIPNGVETALYAGIAPADPGTRNVLFLGRLEARKGPQVLVAALPRLFELVPDANVVIAGDGPLKPALVSAIPEALRARVSFPGAFDTPQRVALLTEANVVCLPARGESFGYTLVEAMAAGRPAVCSDDPGYLCVAQDGHDALVRSPDEPDLFAEALAGLLRDPVAAASLGGRARASAARFDWGQVTGAIEAVYRRVTASPDSIAP